MISKLFLAVLNLFSILNFGCYSSQFQFYDHSKCITITAQPYRFSTIIQHCSYNDGLGFFQFNTSNIYNPSIRGRVVGTAVQELEIQCRDGNSWYLSYNLPYGQYRAAIRLEFENFHSDNYSLIPSLKENLLVDYNFNINPSISLTTNRNKLPLCPSDITKASNGYWLSTSNSTARNISAIWHMNTYKQHELENLDLIYTLKNCQLITPTDIIKCIDGKHPFKKPLRICTYGDSSMRHIHNSIDTLYNESDNFFYWAANRFEKRIKKSSFSRFSYDEWGNCFRRWKKCRHNLNDMPCDYVLVNIGSWPAHYATSPDEYEQLVREMLTNAKRRIYPRRLIWLTTHPNGDLSNSYLSPPKELRTHTLLKVFNNIAIKLSLNLSVDYIDIFKFSSVLNDMTYDGFHYKLPMEREIAKVVLHELCYMKQNIF
eukprot:gene6300-12749_t